LGPVQISVDGNAPPPELLWRRNLALLIYLACSPKRSRTREHLTGLLWPDKAEEKARQSLREALSKIRAAVGEAGVETVGDQVRLVAGAVRLDTDRFQSLAAAGDWEGAAAIVTGAFLEGFAISGAGAFEEWLSAERREWNARGVNALLRSAQVKLDGGDLEATLSVARRAVAMAPDSEAAVSMLMRALALEGNPAEALREYEEFAARLRTELGTTPSAACATLAHRIRSTPGAGGAPERRAPGNARRAPLVGRGEQLERLLEVWRRSRDGERAAGVFLIGDPGVGKTRLAQEVTQRLRLEGAATAVIRAVESDLATPWNGILGLARGGLLEAAGVAGAAPAALAWFAERIAEWADRFPTARGGGAAEAPARAFSEVLGAAAAAQPVVLVVDDAEYLDRDSLLALSAALRDLAHSPLFVLCTTGRAAAIPEVDDLRSQLGRDVDGVVLRLAPLGAADIKQLARWAVPEFDEAALDRLTRRVSTDSAGLPLLLVELLSAVAAGLDLDRIRGAWPEPLRTLDQSLPVELPEAVVGAIRVGFRRVSPAAQRLLQAIAVLEGPVGAERLARATELAAGEVAQALDELEWSRWLTADARGYGFVARIVREIVRQDLVLKGQRQRLLEAAGPS
ncbi:MAG TPA: AAA family ATPase, partial [Gemmatimonadales bacterium]|nr:AAA family ATPase [Gemmatimonadales bacterium]